MSELIRRQNTNLAFDLLERQKQPRVTTDPQAADLPVTSNSDQAPNPAPDDPDGKLDIMFCFCLLYFVCCYGF